MKCKKNVRCNANPQCDAGEDEAGCTISKWEGGVEGEEKGGREGGGKEEREEEGRWRRNAPCNALEQCDTGEDEAGCTIRKWDGGKRG